jgi:hypothetical protein
MPSNSNESQAVSRRGVEPVEPSEKLELGERLYPRADIDTLAQWAAEVHEFLDDAESRD